VIALIKTLFTMGYMFWKECNYQAKKFPQNKLNFYLFYFNFGIEN